MAEQKGKEKGLRISNLPFLYIYFLVVFRCHHGSEGVKLSVTERGQHMVG